MQELGTLLQDKFTIYGLPNPSGITVPSYRLANEGPLPCFRARLVDSYGTKDPELHLLYRMAVSFSHQFFPL